MRKVVASLGVVMVAGAVVSGCSFNFGAGGPSTVSKEDLQKDISDKLANAGQKPESVTDLRRQSGR